MTAGMLREFLRFERRQLLADDGYGNTAGRWYILAGPMAARVEPAAGTEDVQADRPTGQQPVAITVRWSRDAAKIEPQDRAVDQRSSRIWNVIGVANEDERRQYLNIVANQGGADG